MNIVVVQHVTPHLRVSRTDMVPSCVHLRPIDLTGSSQPKYNDPPIMSRSFRCVRSTKFADLRTIASRRPSVCCHYVICGLCDILDTAHRFPHAFLGESSCKCLSTGSFHIAHLRTAKHMMPVFPRMSLTPAKLRDTTQGTPCIDRGLTL